MKKLLLSLCLSPLLTGCIGLSSVGVSDVVSGDAKSSLRAESSGIGFLALTVPSADSLEREAVGKLAAQGAAKNVTTRLTMRNFVIVQLYSVEAIGQK
ncbi:MAG TPA: hypothetical protein VFO10_23965 [Oligoflexus sp.]|uniref:hypothetical protein n=1 Tax=Oligoflexus sp. TaxID=1971216 RepID=UPI002D809069|nr:hypothetical protein [Oligoflexus sp.]HET9240341.1 hypothetical protein [Oligoflexus sp.]